MMTDYRWQPIETAPKDGTEILGASRSDIFRCYWSADEGWSCWYSTDIEDEVVPVFWMPALPPIPRIEPGR